MSQKIYVGNLPYSASDADLQQNFSAFGDVVSATVMTDRDTGRSKGFGFVEMSSPAQAQAAIEGLNGQSVGPRAGGEPGTPARRQRPAWRRWRWLSLRQRRRLSRRRRSLLIN